MANKRATNKKTVSTPHPKSESLASRARIIVANMRSSARHKSFSLSRQQRQIDDEARQVTGGVMQLRQSLAFYTDNWRLFVSLSLIYLVISWMIIGFPDQNAYSEFKAVIDSNLNGGALSVLGVGSLFLGVVGGFAIVERSGLQQFLVGLNFVIFWLVYIWAIRQLQAGHEVAVRQALYNASTPLIALFVLIFIIMLQLIPAAIGLFILIYTFSSDATGASGIEAMLFSIAALMLIVLTIYWLLQSLFAAIVVTLPNMYPLTALSNAKDLVANKRLLVLRRLVAPSLLIAASWTLVLVLAIVIDLAITRGFIPIVSLAIDLLTAFTLPIIIIYLYRLYRELL